MSLPKNLKLSYFSNFSTWKSWWDWDLPFNGPGLGIIDERLAEKYNQDNWNFGANPGFNQYRRITFEKGAIIFNFAVENGQISKMAIYGDLLSRKHADKLQELLTGVSYDAASLTATLDKRFVKHATDANGPERLAESLLS